MFDDGNFGFLANTLDQTFATSRDDDVDKFFQCDQVAHRFAVCGLHQLHGILRQSTFEQSLLDELRQGFVGINRFRAASQDASVTAFNCQ